MNIPRQEALLVVGILFLAGVVFTLIRLLKSRRHGLSLRMQVFLALGLITVLLTSTFAAVIVDRFEARTAVFAYRAAMDDAHVVAALTGRAMDQLGVSLDTGSRALERSRILYLFSSALKDTRVQLLDRGGRPLFDSHSPTVDSRSLARRPEVRAALAGRVDHVARVVSDAAVAAAVPIEVKGEVVGAARVIKGTFSMREVLADTAPKVALLALILASAAALAGVWIGRSVGAPIERLTRAAQKIAKGERQAALPSPRGREVKALTAAFESMRVELEQRHAVESLAADLSHELKNPVASIRAAAEVLEDAVVNDADAALNFTKRIAESAGKMDALIADLLSLARLEARGIAKSVVDVNLSDIARDAVDAVGIRAESRRVEVALHAEPLRVVGDPTWIRRAVENLLINAVAFSPEGAAVSLSLAEAGGMAEVVVSDQGPGIAPALVDKVFERFTTSRKAGDGTGLGLAIVRAVAEAHGGTAEVRATGEGGTTMAFTVGRVSR